MSEKIGETHALCPECLKTIPAVKVTDGDNVYIEKTCEEHGTFKIKIWSGADHYTYLYKFAAVPKTPERFRVRGKPECPQGCGLCEGHMQHSCLNVIEVTNRCNMKCPICFATANDCGYDYHPSMDELKNSFRTVAEYVKSPRCVQLSGGEPTIRDDLPDIIGAAKDMGIEHIEINTNALRIAEDIEYLRKLKDAGADALYMQFDGTDDEIYKKTRGRPMFDIKKKAIANAAEVGGIGITLVATVTPDGNFDQVGNMIEFAASNVPTVKGLHFQPVSYFGRYPNDPSDDDRVLLPDLAKAIEEQTGGMLKADNFMPTSCSNVHCDMKSLSIVMPDGSLFPLTTMALGPPSSTDAVADKTRGEISSLWKFIEGSMDGESGDDGSWRSFVSRAKTHYLTVSAMAFQDAWTGETERWERCCIHVVTPDGRLIPFCLFNTTARDGTTMYRKQAFCR